MSEKKLGDHCACLGDIAQNITKMGVYLNLFH